LRRVRFALLFAILALFTVSNSGCLWLAVPELAYEGYKATEGKNTGTTSAQASSKPRTKPASSTQQTDTGTDTSIE